VEGGREGVCSLGKGGGACWVERVRERSGGREGVCSLGLGGILDGARSTPLLASDDAGGTPVLGVKPGGAVEGGGGELTEVVGDVGRNPVKVLLVSDESIEVVPLPEGSLAGFKSIDSSGREGFPGGNDGGEVRVPREGEEQVHVVGHDDKVVQEVAFTIEKMKGVADNCGEFRLRQLAFAVAGIKPAVDFCREATVVFQIDGLGPWLGM